MAPFHNARGIKVFLCDRRGYKSSRVSAAGVPAGGLEWVPCLTQDHKRNNPFLARGEEGTVLSAAFAAQTWRLSILGGASETVVVVVSRCSIRRLPRRAARVPTAPPTSESRSESRTVALNQPVAVPTVSAASST